MNVKSSGVIPQILLELSLAVKIMDWSGVDDTNVERARKLLAELKQAENTYSIWRPEHLPDILDFAAEA
jgi:hypothetical protein